MRNAALMREAALKSTIFVGVPRVCSYPPLAFHCALIDLFFPSGGFVYRSSELSQDSRTRSKGM